MKGPSNPEELLARFWEWRKKGRPLQTLRQDLGLFLRGYVPILGRDVCAQVYREAMKYYEWDLAQGGRVPREKAKTEKPKTGGLRAYS